MATQFATYLAATGGQADPDALYSVWGGANDRVAVGCYGGVQEAGGQVGRDVSVTGSNDIPLLDWMQPPMTSVRVPYRQMGVEAANTLLAMMASGSTGEQPISIRLTPVLSVRGSTGPPPRCGCPRRWAHGWPRA